MHCIGVETSTTCQQKIHNGHENAQNIWLCTGLASWSASTNHSTLHRLQDSRQPLTEPPHWLAAQTRASMYSIDVATPSVQKAARYGHALNNIQQFGTLINSTSFHAKNWLKLKNYVQKSDSCKPLFYIQITRTWRHSDMISGQPAMVGTKLLFAHRV